jgi:deoxyribose-phosphate aldolase
MKWLIGNIDREFSPGEVENSVSKILENAVRLNNRETFEIILSSIDLTTLNPTDTEQQAETLAEKVNRFHENYPNLPNVAAICVYPVLIKAARKNLRVEGVKVASVSGGFPSSMTFTEVKKLETSLALNEGADEIDIVLPLGLFLSENYTEVVNEIGALKKICGKVILKVILETGALKTPGNIWKASILAMQAGADFIKTSTGKYESAATPEAAWVMCKAIRAYYEKTGRKVGFKAAGGIVESANALPYVAIVQDVLGDEWLNNRLFRIGASRLANNLLTSIKGNPVTYF